jgi:hypothetical protein
MSPAKMCSVFPAPHAGKRRRFRHLQHPNVNLQIRRPVAARSFDQSKTSIAVLLLPTGRAPRHASTWAEPASSRSSDRFDICECARCSHATSVSRRMLLHQAGLLVAVQALGMNREIWGPPLRQIRHGLLQRGLYCRARADLLEIAGDDVLALGDTFEHRDEAAIGGAERNEAQIGLVAFADDVDVFAKLT